MTYPLQIKETNEKAIKTVDEKLAKLNADLGAASDPAAQARIKAAIDAQQKAKAVAVDTIAKLGDSRTSLVGLEKPLITLKNPGLISIPLGFICVVLGSLFYRDRRAEEMWEELYVRQNTGIAAEGAVAH